jgi:hypothetical protein
LGGIDALSLVQHIALLADAESNLLCAAGGNGDGPVVRVDVLGAIRNGPKLSECCRSKMACSPAQGTAAVPPPALHT